MRIENDFHINGCALSLALKQRLGPTRKWPKTDFTALNYILINYLLCYHRQNTKYVEKKSGNFLLLQRASLNSGGTRRIKPDVSMQRRTFIPF